MKFSNFRIGIRLSLGFAIVLSLGVAVGILSINKLGMINAATTEINNNWLVGTRALAEYSMAINSIRRAEAQHVMSKTDGEFSALERRIQDTMAKADAALDTYAATLVSPDSGRLLSDLKTAQKRYFSADLALTKVSRDSKGFSDALHAVYGGESLDALKKLIVIVDQDIESQSKGADAAFKFSQDQFSSARNTIIFLLICSVAAGAALAVAITRSITRPVHDAVQFAEAVAAGDLTGKIDSDSPDEIGQLLRALMKMSNDLSTVVLNVRHGSESVATASAEISAGNLDLSARTEEQAGSLEETAASMEELNSTVKQNAENARQADKFAQSASSVAKKGGEVVTQVVETMDGINHSSKQIVEIISVIDGIAFQTNILALNAAVEAARAGEQGRGFAVVATEVRNLAQRSAAAAKEIKTLISASVDRVNHGTALVAQAGSTMTEIVDSIERVTAMMSEITAASVEQSLGVAQVGQAVTQIDEVTQQNAALVEEMSAAASGLEMQAKDLVASVALFKLVDPVIN